MSYYKYCRQKKLISNKKIFQHLEKCNELFVPKLSDIVNIIDYSNKIYINAELFYYLYNKEIVALVACYLNNTDDYTGYITNVSVLIEHQKKGLSKKLLNKCIDYAKSKKFREIVLQVNTDNIIAKKIYSDIGFVTIAGVEDKMKYIL